MGKFYLIINPKFLKMKTNKATIFTLVGSCLLFSCSNNDMNSSDPAMATSTTYEVISSSNLPVSINSSMTAKQVGGGGPIGKISEVDLVSDGTYVAYISNSLKGKTKMSYTAKGKLLSKINLTPIAVSDLIGAITAYISDNYVGSTILNAHLESDGGFDVFISAADGTKVKLNFTADGTFVSESVLRAEGNHRHKHSGNHTPIAISDLADSIISYIDSNYSGATITSAHLESDGSFDVFITTAEGAKFNLNFSAAGEFVSVSSDAIHHSDDDTPIVISDLNTAITTYIETNYAGATVNGAHAEADGQIEVNITTTEGVRLELKFTAAGDFVSLSSHSNNHYRHVQVSVNIANLVNAIKTYIETNYAGATIIGAHLDSDGTYDVLITTASGTNLKLEFSATGVFKEAKSN